MTDPIVTSDPKVIEAWNNRAKAQYTVSRRTEKLKQAELVLAAADDAYNASIRPTIPTEPNKPQGYSYGSARRSVVTFTKKFGGSTNYEYAAIRPEGHSGWAITAVSTTIEHRGRTYQWAQLMEFVVSKELNMGRTALGTVRQWMMTGQS